MDSTQTLCGGAHSHLVAAAQFLPLDSLPEDANINLVESKTREHVATLIRTPMVLVPLEPCEKTGDSVLVGSNGNTFGNKSDFKVGSPRLLCCGAVITMLPPPARSAPFVRPMPLASPSALTA